VKRNFFVVHVIVFGSMAVTCLEVCIIYFISCDYKEFFIILYNILKLAELDCCQIIISSLYVPSTHAYTHVLCLSLDLPYEKR
jgi:hypothetical protein